MLFDADDYRIYLRNEIVNNGRGRGTQTKLAAHLNCQTSFLSHVLSERAHLSLEHAMSVSDYFAHTPLERKYFLLLVQKGKAGSKALTDYFENELASIQAEREIVKEKIGVNTELSLADQAIYYSMWWYLAVHMLVGFPKTQTRSAIADKLGLRLDTVSDILEFLASRNLVTEKDGHYKIGKGRVHIGPHSPLTARHHANWRLRAIDMVEEMKPRNLHFSGVIGISKKDAERIRGLILDLLQKTEVILKPSKEEVAYVMNLDFAEL